MSVENLELEKQIIEGKAVLEETDKLLEQTDPVKFVQLLMDMAQMMKILLPETQAKSATK